MSRSIRQPPPEIEAWLRRLRTQLAPILAQVERLRTQLAPFLTQAEPHRAHIERLVAQVYRDNPLLGQLARGELEVSPLAANVLTLFRTNAADGEREQAVQWLRAWLEPTPIPARRCRQLLAELRRSGFRGPQRRDALEQQILAAIVAAVGPLGHLTFTDMAQVLPRAIVKEVTEGVLGARGRRPRPSLDAAIETRLAVAAAEAVERPSPAALRAVLRRAKLAPREQQILSLMGRGLADATIARRLGLQPSTIRALRKRATEKLKATRR